MRFSLNLLNISGILPTEVMLFLPRFYSLANSATFPHCSTIKEVTRHLVLSFFFTIEAERQCHIVDSTIVSDMTEDYSLLAFFDSLEHLSFHTEIV